MAARVEVAAKRDGFAALVELTGAVFSAPSFAIFKELLGGWVLAPGRRTITAIISVADPGGRRAHDAYHRFIRDGAWVMARLWRVLAIHVIARFAPEGVIALDCDDTLFHKSGRRIDGAGVFRDAVRSSARRVVYAMGLNLVVVSLRVTPPWGGCPIALPVNVALHRKADPITTVAHAAEMIRELADWLPGRHFHSAPTAPTPPWPAPGYPVPTSPPACAATLPSMRRRLRVPAGAAGPAPKATGCPPHPSSPPRPDELTGNE